VDIPAKRGRKPVPQHLRKQYKNIALDEDINALLNNYADELEPLLGFRPTLSQAVRHLLLQTRRHSG
jgi:hypothetical protein